MIKVGDKRFIDTELRKEAIVQKIEQTRQKKEKVKSEQPQRIKHIQRLESKINLLQKELEKLEKHAFSLEIEQLGTKLTQTSINEPSQGNSKKSCIMCKQS